MNAIDISNYMPAEQSFELLLDGSTNELFGVTVTPAGKVTASYGWTSVVHESMNVFSAQEVGGSLYLFADSDVDASGATYMKHWQSAGACSADFQVKSISEGLNPGLGQLLALCQLSGKDPSGNYTEYNAVTCLFDVEQVGTDNAAWDAGAYKYWGYRVLGRVDTQLKAAEWPLTLANSSDGRNLKLAIEYGIEYTLPGMVKHRERMANLKIMSDIHCGGLKNKA
jgi:hypothetical protein